MFGALKRAIGAGATQVKTEYAGNKNFLEGVIAACALVAAADGDIEDAERAKISALLKNHTQLSMYPPNEVEAVADRYLRLAKDASGRAQLGREMAEVKHGPDGKRMCEDIYLAAVDIANADGEVEPQEKAVLEKIAKVLDVNPADFQF